VIGRLRGEVIDRDADTIVVDVQGVGYLVRVARAEFGVGTSVDLHIHTHVREDSLALFGFAEPFEREVFNLLLTVPSIGPVKAMGILGTPVPALVDMVARRDAKGIAKLPGVGKRTAERMVVDLGDKFAALAPTLRGAISGEAEHTTRVVSSMADDLASALTNLGFKSNVAETEANRAVSVLGADAGLDALLRHSLDQLRRK